MKKIFNVIIIFTLLIIIGINEVDAKWLECSCEYQQDSESLIGFKFEIESKNLSSGPKFTSNYFKGELCNSYSHVQGVCNEYYEPEITNWFGPIDSGDNYSFINDYISNESCPANLIFLSSKSLYSLGSGTYYIFASSTNNIEDVKTRALSKFGSSYKTFVLPCSVTNSKEDEPEIEPEPEPEEEEDNSEHPGVEEGGRVKGDTGSKGYCGSEDVDTAIMENIPADVPRITEFIYNFLQVLVPLAIIILGSIDLVKAISAQKEDEIKKGQQMLIKRLITAVIVFFVFALVKLLVSVVSDNSQGIVDCVNCFLTNDNKYCNFN